MTPEGYHRLLAEIEEIKSVERPANIKALEEARGHGDLSENADYDAAKNAQGMIEARLRVAEDRLARAEVVDPKSLSGADVKFGATVTVADSESGEESCYQILGTFEADAKKGIISLDSPLGRALIGKQEGDEIAFGTPNGERHLVITQVEYK